MYNKQQCRDKRETKQPNKSTAQKMAKMRLTNLKEI